MLSPNHQYQVLHEKVTTDVIYIVENYLLNDWAISIEHTDDIKYLNTKWERWGKTFYKPSNASIVIDSIFSCHDSNPLNAIRLYAEKYTPASRFCLFITEGSNNSIKHDEISPAINNFNPG